MFDAVTMADVLHYAALFFFFPYFEPDQSGNFQQ
jgi:hypothetical protein